MWTSATVSVAVHSTDQTRSHSWSHGGLLSPLFSSLYKYVIQCASFLLSSPGLEAVRPKLSSNRHKAAEQLHLRRVARTNRKRGMGGRDTGGGGSNLSAPARSPADHLAAQSAASKPTLFTINSGSCQRHLRTQRNL